MTDIVDDEFIGFVRKECKENGIKLLLKNSSYIKANSLPCSGWFDAETKELRCATKRKDFIEILVHEYCHLTQWKENIPLWKKCYESFSVLDDWLMGKDVPDIAKHIKNIRDLELDNEKRAVKLIKKWGLNIDLDEYVRKANAYILFYNWLLITRRWPAANVSLYGNKKIISCMSTKFNMKYDGLTEKMKDLFEKENI